MARAPIATIEATTGELAKQAINGLLGLWGIDQHYSWVISTQADEYFALPHKDKVMIRKAPGGVDVAYRQELLYCSSMRPIVHQVLDREKLLLAELRQALDEYAHRSRNFGGRKEADDNWPMDASASPSGASGHNHRDGDGGVAFLRADGVTDGVTDGGGAVRGG